MRALAHPHLDYCQSALAHPTEAAASYYRRAYHRTARVAARTERSEPALHVLEWPRWERRRAASRAAFAAKVWYEREPAALRDLLPAPPQLPEDRMHTRAMTRKEVEEPQPSLVLGQKAFRYWGPRVLNQVIRNTVYEDCAPQEARPRREKTKKPLDGAPNHGPPDTDVVVRRTYYAELAEKFSHTWLSLDADGRVCVWTDGSCKTLRGEKSAGAGVFYGAQNPGNAAVSVEGAATSPRAELAALLYVLKNDPRPLSIRTDCRYVQMGVTEGRLKWRARAWFRRPLDCQLIEHADLWQEIDRMLEIRGPGHDTTQWCKGHGLESHIRQGLTSELDVWGNCGSDYLAGVAARTDCSSERARASKRAQVPKYAIPEYMKMGT
eukprot:gene3793-biopygen16983